MKQLAWIYSVTLLVSAIAAFAIGGFVINRDAIENWYVLLFVLGSFGIVASITAILVNGDSAKPIAGASIILLLSGFLIVAFF